MALSKPKKPGTPTGFNPKRARSQSKGTMPLNNTGALGLDCAPPDPPHSGPSPPAPQGLNQPGSGALAPPLSDPDFRPKVQNDKWSGKSGMDFYLGGNTRIWSFWAP